MWFILPLQVSIDNYTTTTTVANNHSRKIIISICETANRLNGKEVFGDRHLCGYMSESESSPDVCLRLRFSGFLLKNAAIFAWSFESLNRFGSRLTS